MKKICILMLCFVLFACSGRKEKYQTMQTGTVVPFYQTYSSDVEIESQLRTVRVGVLLPLSGKYEKLGNDLRNATDLALFGFAKNFEFFPYDTKGTAEGAVDAFHKVKEKSVEIILGPVMAEEVAAVAPLARRYDIPMITFTSDKDNLGDGVYSMALTLENQTERIIRFACEKGSKKISILAPDNKAGDIAIDAAKKAAEACGIEVKHLSVYNPTFVNFNPYVTAVLPEAFVKERKEISQKKKKLRAGLIKKSDLKDTKQDEEAEEPLTIAEQLDFDALFIADDGNRLKSISALFGLYDVSPDDVLFLGLSTWDDTSLSKEGSLKNSYYPVLPKKGYNTFSDKFNNSYGKKPSRLASLGYDAVSLAWLWTKQPNWKETRFLMENEFIGTDGTFRFRLDGTTERLMGINQIKGDNRFVRIEMPSSNFVEEDEKKAQMQEIKYENTQEE